MKFGFFHWSFADARFPWLASRILIQLAAFLFSHVVYALLCVREIWIGASGSSPTIYLLLLTVPWFAMAWWRTSATLTAFVVYWPLLLGAGRAGLLQGNFQMELAFAAMSCAFLMRGLMGQLHRSQWSRWKLRLAHEETIYIAAIDALMVMVAISVTTQSITVVRTEGANALLRQISYGFSDPLFFVSNGTTWLAGLYFARLLLSGIVLTRVASISDSSYRNTAATSCLWFGVWFQAPILIVFLGIQYVSKMPGFYPYTVDGVYSVAVPMSPFGDHHAFGSAAVLFGILAAGKAMRIRWISLAPVMMCAILLGGVLLSYSRAAWVASVAAVVVGCFLLSRRLAVVLLIVGVGVLIVVSGNSGKLKAINNAYITRLVNIATVPTRVRNGEEVRVSFYAAAYRMMKTHPMTGVGIGHSYAASASYNEHGEREFLHCTFLQFGAEVGVPGMLVYLSLLAAPFLCAYRMGLSRLTHSQLVLTCALCCYLMTQVTANALNIYEEQQILFWTLYGSLMMSFLPRGGGELSVA